MQAQAKYIYFEKQLGGMTCGVHCINALLQGPHFDEVQLSNIAIRLDQEEKKLFGGAGDSAGLRQGQVSHNVANDGNFSI